MIAYASRMPSEITQRLRRNAFPLPGRQRNSTRTCVRTRFKGAVYRSGSKHSDTDCLSKVPIELAPTGDDDEESLLAVNVNNKAKLQRDDSVLHILSKHL